MPRVAERPAPGRLDSGEHLAVLDLRPLLARGEHPIALVLGAADALAPDGVLELVAPFEPRPLAEKLRMRGCTVSAIAMADGTWVVRAARGALPPLEELSELEPPEPLGRVLTACSALAPGTVYCARLPRVPALLFPELDARGLEWRVAERPDGTAVLWVRSPRT